jgi:septum site-determining protein MinC
VLPFIRVRGRSFLALVLAPTSPEAAWLEALDGHMKQSPSFFAGRPVIIDLSAMPPGSDLGTLVSDCERRELRIIGVEGADMSWTDTPTWGRTPLLGTGREDRFYEVPADKLAPELPAQMASGEPASREPASLVLTEPVRSGQTVMFLQGDVTIVGSVASGAEVLAGGSIHIYGTLRGRAMAGLLGQADARIFCSKMDAEMVAIDGIYTTADDIAPALRNRPVQAWLADDAVVLSALD